MSQQWDQDSPIYLQLYQQVIKRILDGYIAENEALPSVRNVASEYTLNPITISKAYQMLQDQNIVEKQRGKGLFVREGAKAAILTREKELFLNKEWPRVVKQIARLDLSVAELLAQISNSNEGDQK